MSVNFQLFSVSVGCKGVPFLHRVILLGSSYSICGNFSTGQKRVSFEEFIPIYHNQESKRRKGAYESFVESFKVFDRDGSGQISSAEVRHMLTSLGEYSSCSIHLLKQQQVDRAMFSALRTRSTLIRTLYLGTWMTLPGVLGVLEPSKNLTVPPSASKFLKIFIHCWRFHNMFSFFQAIMKCVVCQNFLADLTVSILAVLAPQNFFPGAMV